MAASEGVYIKKAEKPNKLTQKGEWSVVSGTVAGRDEYLLRHDTSIQQNEKQNSIDITRHRDEGERKPRLFDKNGKDELIYSRINHHNKVRSIENPAEKAKKLAEEIKKQIEQKG